MGDDIPEPLSDRELVQRALAGDLAAKSEIVRRHQDLVYNLALKLVSHPEAAECVLQDTFLKVFEKLGTFRQESSLQTWIYRIATNEALMRLRQRKYTTVPVEEESAEEDTSRFTTMLKSLDRNPLELLLDNEFKAALERAMAELPDSWRIPFVLKDIEGLSLQEIADQLNTTVPAVKSALHRGRTALRNQLAEFITKHELGRI